ncbi:MAG: hypothetical protein CMO55_05805 [Verrucomicrobiales bacterium]|nr:hypothetical protein [Verrucomicrobiales bacterium]
MKKKSADYLTRRNFLGRSACSTMALTGVVNTLAHLKMMQASLAQGGPAPGYKALVVLFLYGGNDSNNTLIPQSGHPEYANYKSNRGILGILDPTDPDVDPAVGSSIPLTGTGDPYGVHPEMGEVASLYNSGDLSFVANVGTLSWPVSRTDYLDPDKAGLLPPQLYSHSDQQIQWQSSLPDQPFRTGWGGRAADLLAGSQGGSVSLSISLAGINSLQVGESVSQYAVTSNGAIALSGYGTDYANAIDSNTGDYLNNNNGRRLQAFDAVTDYVHAHLLEEGYNDVVKTSRINEGIVNDAVAASQEAAIDTAFDNVGATSGVANQLKMIAKLISGRSSLGNSRQIFFCSAGGYDTHQNQISAHGSLMGDLSKALAGFNAAVKAVGDDDNVMLISHSDFTRTLTPNGTDVNGSGSDHGWGGHQIVMGGPVDGGKVFGEFPPLLVNAGIDAGTTRGRWIPSTSVDQYAAVAGNWLDVPDLSVVFPNLGRFEDPFGGSSLVNYVV